MLAHFHNIPRVLLTRQADLSGLGFARDRENDQGLVIRALEDVLQQPLLVDIQPINGFLVLLSRNVRRGVPEMVSA